MAELVSADASYDPDYDENNGARFDNGMTSLKWGGIGCGTGDRLREEPLPIDENTTCMDVIEMAVDKNNIGPWYAYRWFLVRPPTKEEWVHKGRYPEKAWVDLSNAEILNTKIRTLGSLQHLMMSGRMRAMAPEGYIDGETMLQFYTRVQPHPAEETIEETTALSAAS